MLFFSAVVTITLSVLAAAENFTVTVGKDGGLTYDPPFVNAKAGDTIAFQFLSKNHTVTQSTFAKPCEKMSQPATGVDSGFFAVAANVTAFPQWCFTINNASAPLWFYCRQQTHCQKGMVFAVNPTAEKSYDAFKAAAMGTTSASGTSSVSGSAATTSPGAQTNGALSLRSSISGLLMLITAYGMLL